MPRFIPRIRFRLHTLLLLPVLVSVVFWHFDKPRRTIGNFKDAFARGDMAAVNQMCTNARFSVDTPDWEGSLLRHFPRSTWLPNNWSDVAQDMFDDFRDSHIVADEQTISQWWYQEREFHFASAHTLTPPDRTSIGPRWEAGKIVSAETVYKYWDYRAPTLAKRSRTGRSTAIIIESSRTCGLLFVVTRLRSTDALTNPLG